MYRCLILPFSCAIPQKGSKLRSIGMFEEQHKEGFVELEGAWELAEDLPHTVQEEKKNWRLLTRLAVGVCGLGAALLEWVTRLVKDSNRLVMSQSAKTKQNEKKTKIKHRIVTFNRNWT